jgi:hypothetical protein
VLDFSDDRLAHLLNHLSQAKYWHPIEQAINERSMTLYDLSAEVIRCDATTVSADQEGVEGLRIKLSYLTCSYGFKPRARLPYRAHIPQ